MLELVRALWMPDPDFISPKSSRSVSQVLATGIAMVGKYAPSTGFT
jgi:hypothetical protein